MARVRPTPGLVDAASWERGRPARKWAKGPQVFKRARCPRSQEKRRLPHRLSRGDSIHAARARSPGPRAPPGSAGVPPASGPKAHRCSSGQDARAPRKSAACLIVSPEATRPTRPPLGPRDRVRPPGSAGVPPASGPKAHRCVFKRARCPRSQERHRLSHRLSRGDSTRSTHAAPARPPGPRAPPWERVRPARKWAEGPPVCSSGQDARAPRKGALR